MQYIGRLIGVASLLLLCGTMEAQQTKSPEAKSPEVKDVFADNPKLLQKVKVECEGMAVGELLALLSQKTGVKLSADRGVADDKVVLFSPARPLRETLTDLAALYHDLWQHIKTDAGGDRYFLLRTRRSSEYEQTLLKAANARMIAKLEEQVKAL